MTRDSFSYPSRESGETMRGGGTRLGAGTNNRLRAITSKGGDGMKGRAPFIGKKVFSFAGEYLGTVKRFDEFALEFSQGWFHLGSSKPQKIPHDSVYEVRFDSIRLKPRSDEYWQLPQVVG